MKTKILTLLAILSIALTTSCQKEEPPKTPDKPKTQMYKEPYLNFTGDVSQIKSYETRELLYETTTALSYIGENSKVTAVMYVIKNRYHNGAIVFIPYSDANAKLLVDFLNDKYMVTTSGSDIVFLSKDRKVGGTVTVSNAIGDYHYLVTYIDPKINKSLSGDNYDLDKALQSSIMGQSQQIIMGLNN